MALEEKEISAIRPDALGPAAIEAKAEDLAVGKVALQPAKCFVLAMLAGMFIGFGALLFTFVCCDGNLSFGVQRVLGGACFAVGLEMVVCCGAELFTGNSLMVCGLASKKIDWAGMLKNWVIVWVGNFVGALLLVFCVYMSNTAGMNSSAVGASMVSIALGKATMPWVTIFFRGILCNVLVCLAVWIGFSARTVADKMIGILLPITAFVACGFEHCVANMFFLFMGLVAKGAGFAAVDASGLTVASAFYNLSASTLGNIVGGAIVVGLAYWFVYHKKN